MGENESMDDRRFTQEETADLIRRATELRHQQDDELTYDQLIEIAEEVGIDKRSVDEALRAAEIEEAERADRASAVQHTHSVLDRCLEILCLKPRSGT